MALKFEITGDNSNLLSSLDGARAGVDRAAKEIERSGLSIEDMFKRIAAAAGIAFSLGQVKSFASSVMDMRGQFQQLEIAFTTMLQSEEKANALMAQLVDTAAKTPFDLQGVADGAKQLLAYGTEAEEVNETIIRLGDIAAGLSIPLGDLVYLYGTTMTQGRMFTQDLRQFMGRGIPMAEQLAKQFGVTKDEVSDLVTAGKVGADEVKKVIWNMTNEGSKFGGLMEKQSASITGQIANIEDAIDVMLNDIGQSQEGIINMGLDLAGKIVENWKKVGEAIAVAATAYGSYKAILMAVTAYQTIESRLLGQIALEKSLAAAAGIQLSNAEAMAVAKTKLLTIAQNGLSAALKRVAAATIANPYVLAAAAVTALAYGIYKLATRQDEATKAQQRLNETCNNAIAEMKSEQAEIDNLFGKLRKAKEGTEEYKRVKDQILGQYGKYLDGLGTEISTLRDVEGAYKAVTKAAREASIARGKEAALKETQDKYGKAYADNIGKLQEALNKQVGGKKASSTLKLVQQELQRTGTISLETENKVRGMFVGTFNYGNSGAWITSLRNNEKYLKENTELVEQRFQLDEEEEKHEEKKTVRNKKAIEDEKKEYQSKLESLSKEEAAGKKGLELKKKIWALDKELKAYDSGGKQDNKEGKDAVSRRQKKYELDAQLQQEQEKQSQATRDAIEQARIAAIEDGGARERAEQDEQHRLNLQSVDDREKEMKKALYEYNKSVWENQNKDESKKYSDTAEGKAGWEGLALTKEQEAELQALRDKENVEYARIVGDRFKQEAQAMRDYLSEYGSFQDQRKAINAEYEQKIADESSAVRKRALEAERDQKLSEISLNELKNGIDWETVFGNLSNYSVKALQKLKQQLRRALDVEDISVENAQILAEKINETENTITDKSDVLASILPGLRERKRLTEQAAAAEEVYQKALNDEVNAINKVAETKELIKEQLDKLDIRDATGQKIEIDLAAISEENKEMLLSSLDKGSDLYKGLLKLFENLAADSADFKKTHQTSQQKKNLKQSFDDMLSGKKALKQFANDIFDFEGEGFTKIVSLVNDNAQSMSEFVDKVGLEGTDFGDAVQGFADGAAGFSNAIQSLESGDVIGAVNGVLDGIAGYTRAFTVILGGNGNEDEMEERIAELAKSNETLASSIDSLAERIADGDSTNQESVEAYKQAYQAEQDWERNQREAINSRASEWTNTGYGFMGLGGKSSFNKHMKGNDWSGWEKFSQVLKEHGENVKVNRDNIWDLTPEQMKLLRDFAPEQWAALMNGDGHKNPKDLVNEYIDRAGILEEITSALNEKLTGYSWDGFRNSFSSVLTDMDSDLKDFGENIEEVLSEAILNSLLTTKYKARIDELYKMIADAAMDDEITKTEADAIRATNEQIAKDMLADRQALLDLGIISGESYQQEASAKGFQSMSQDTGEELNGRFTALQISGDTIAQQAVQIYGQMMAIAAIQTSSNNFLAEIRNLMITSNSYLDNVSKYSKKMYLEFGEKLDSVISNTKNL